MNGKTLIDLFLKHISQPDIPYLDDTEYAAILFGSDEVKIDRRNRRIRLNNQWIRAAGSPPPEFDFDWVALVCEEDGWSVVFGSGNPFEESSGLPTKNGKVIAVPKSYNPTT